MLVGYTECLFYFEVLPRQEDLLPQERARRSAPHMDVSWVCPRIAAQKWYIVELSRNLGCCVSCWETVGGGSGLALVVGQLGETSPSG